MNLNHAMSVQSDFSIGRSLLQVEHIIDKAVEHGYESVVLCDDMSLHAMVDFTNRAKKAGIRPVVGCRVKVYLDPTYRKPAKATGIKEVPNPFYTLKVYITSEEGEASLFKLLSKANSPEHFYYNARAGIGDVLALEGVAISTGDMYGMFHVNQARYSEDLQRLQMKFGVERVFVELVPINTPLFDTLNGKAIQAALDYHAPTLVTYPFLTREEDDHASLDVMGAIANNTQMDLSYRSKQHVRDFYFAPPSVVVGRVKAAALRVSRWAAVSSPNAWGSGVANCQKLIDMCAYTFSKKEVCLPKMADNEFMALGKLCLLGWRKRFSAPVLGHQPSAFDLHDHYKPRLEYELSVLKKMNFSGYFLLVEDLVSWAKNNAIIVGPGRGSVGGSLVAYLIGITDVDPLRFNLLFERFINPERQDLPDADLDFMSSKRHLVVEYLTGKYGADRVAGISNYSTLASASALRDTGRVFGLSGLQLMATKLVPKEHGQSFNLTESAEKVPELEKFKDDNPEVWGHAIKLEGIMKNFGQHAAGIIVAGEPLVNRAVVETRGESPVVSWDKRVVEDFGLVKMDLLGLSTLDVLQIAKVYIEERHGVVVNYIDLPLEEPDVMDAFGRGDTTGVFQFESGGMKKLLRSLAEGGQLTFEDITAATALYRPGPMDSGLMDDFIRIKQGIKTPYFEHEKMKGALMDTYGVIVYQEQVMRLAIDLAAFTGAESDNLRKAMGKKDKDKMAEMRQKWVDGCVASSGMEANNAGLLFDKIEAFAGYGFNKSHATEYSIISVWTMWVRCRYPAEYFAACMSIVKEDKLPGLVRDARECGIEVLPPDINRSCDKFTIPDDKHILAPFSAVTGISENTALRIVELRANNGDWVDKVKRGGAIEQVPGDGPPKGRFDSLKEFQDAALQKGSKVNVTVVKNLGLVGAYALIEPGSLPARHLDRRKDQTELMPGLIIDAVKADRQTDMTDKFLRAKVITLAQEFKKCTGCSLAGAPHPSTRCGNTVKYMVVSDCPTWEEEGKDKLLEGQAASYVKAAIIDAGLKVGDGYFTTLVKAKKNDKFLSNAQINGCKQFIDRELALVKPSVIVALGSASIKYFLPGVKGSTAELAGKVFFDPKLDASIVCGINAQQIGFDPSKADILSNVFTQVADILV